MPRKALSNVAASRLHELFSYDEKTGILRWKVARSNRIKVGDIAGGANSDGYRVVWVEGKLLLVHRVVWAMQTGRWPSSHLDHRDMNKSNNRFDNLRECNDSQNMANGGIRKSNTSGFKGVTPSGNRKKWKAQITYQKKLRYLGTYDTREEAHHVYCREAEKLFGEFARSN